jgi:hypothetical protein
MKQPREKILKIVAVRFAFCYNTNKPCFAGWAGFLITLLHYPLFAYFPHTQDSQLSVFHKKIKKGDRPLFKGLSLLVLIFKKIGIVALLYKKGPVPFFCSLLVVRLLIHY